MTEKKEEVFKADGRYTFLIPVEEGFRVSCLATFPYRSSRKDLNIPCCEPRERIQTVPARSAGPRKWQILIDYIYHEPEIRGANSVIIAEIRSTTIDLNNRLPATTRIKIK